MITRTSRTLFCVAALLFAVSGCGGMTRQVVRNATPTAVQTGLATATSDESQDMIVESLEPERVEEATERIAAGTTDGLVNALGEEERQERLTQAVAPMVSSMVDTAINQALNDENLERVRALAKQATLGFQDAIDEVKTQKDDGTIPADKGNVLEAVNDVAESGDVTLYALGAVAALLALVLIIGAVLAVRRKRKYEYEASLRDKALDEISRILADGQRGTNLEANGHDRDRDDSEAVGDPERLREALRRLAEQRSATQQASGHASAHKQ